MDMIIAKQKLELLRQEIYEANEKNDYSDDVVQKVLEYTRLAKQILEVY